MFRPLTVSVRSVVALLTIGVAACSQTGTPVGPGDHEQNPLLSAQHLANLRAIETERQASNARYDALVAAWNNRHNGDGPMRTTSSSSTFVPCAPLPFSGEAQIVGSAGGEFYFGPHTLTVPAGALSGDVSIAVMVATDVKTEVTLLPHGTQFSVPVKLHLAYGHCDQAATHRVAYVDAQDNIIEWTNSADNPTASFVEASLSHFSQYAIAY